MAKIYDPVFFDDDETSWVDPFALRDLTISCEVEAYRRLGPLQGTQVPRFYRYFAAAVPTQQGQDCLGAAGGLPNALKLGNGDVEVGQEALLDDEVGVVDEIKRRSARCRPQWRGWGWPPFRRD